MDSQTEFSLQRSRLYAAAGLPPPPTVLGSHRGLTSDPGGTAAFGHDLQGSAASAMSSLAQLQTRYLPDSLAYHGQGSSCFLNQ